MIQFRTLKVRFYHISQSNLVKNTLWMLLAQGGRLCLQAAYFIIIARSLGAEQYGAFVGALALVSVFAPFATLGAGNLLIKNVSRNRSTFSEYWGNALFMISTSGFVFTVLLMSLAPLFLPSTISPLLLLLVAISDLFFFRMLDTAGQAFQAVSWLSKTAWLNLLPGLTRMGAALALVTLFHQTTAIVWAGLYLGSTAVAAMIAVSMVHHELSPPKLALWRIRPEIREGCYFSVSLSAQTIYNDIDKTMLARLATLESTGVYAAAYRLIDVAFAPVRSLLAASYAKFFQQGASGITGSLQLAKKLTPIAGGYGFAAMIGLLLCAPIVPQILGEQYRSTIDVLRWLAPLPFLKAMHYFAADTLTGAGLQGLRSTAQICIAVFNVLLNLWLIPRFTWQGAVWSSLASDGLLMLGLWTIVIVLYRTEMRFSKQPMEPSG